MAEPEPLGEDDISPEAIERRRREDKRERVANACQSSDVADLFSLWQETTDLLFRTNLVEGSRVEELWDLRRITFALTAVAHNRQKERLSLQKLSALLRTLMPREWFPDASTRSKVLEAIMAANVEVEELYLASLKGDTAPLATPPAAEGPTSHPKEVGYADAMQRYTHSCDDMRAMLLNPVKAMPWGNWPEETQLGRGVITRAKDGKRYVRYLLRIAAENERLVGQARVWWAWWEKTQVDPSKAGPAPLVSERIETVLRMAGRRREQTPIVSRAGSARRQKASNSGGAQAKKQDGSQRGRPSAQAIDAAARDYLEKAVQAAAEARQPYVPDRTSLAKAVSKELNYEIKVPSLFATKQAGADRVPRYPAFLRLWKTVQLASRDARRSKMKQRST